VIDQKQKGTDLKNRSETDIFRIRSFVII